MRTKANPGDFEISFYCLYRVQGVRGKGWEVLTLPGLVS